MRASTGNAGARRIVSTQTVTAMKCEAMSCEISPVFGPLTRGSSDTTIGTKRTAASVVAVRIASGAACAPIDAKKISCPGPAQTSGVESAASQAGEPTS